MTIFSSTSRDDLDQNVRSSYFNLPPLDVSIAFPQATPASVFPPCASNYFQLDDPLTPEEKAIRMKVRQCMEQEIAPIMTEYWEKAKFPFHVIPKLGALNIAGGTIKGNGCPGLSITSSIVVSAQKQKYLPSLAQLNIVACWALIEPGYGSDVSAMKTTATTFCALNFIPLTYRTHNVQGGWILEGQKRWIENSTFADLLFIFARNATTNQINGFIVKKDAPGLTATEIENKIGLRIVQNRHIILRNVFVADEDRLFGIDSFQDANKSWLPSVTISESATKVLYLVHQNGVLEKNMQNKQSWVFFCPHFIAWQPIGISMGIYDMCHRYLKERKQFRAPLAAFQINQQKLVHMLGNVQAMILVGWCLCKLYENGKMTLGQASLGKSWITLKARETAAIKRELIGDNGILADFLVAKAFCDLEPIYIYEGTHDINNLVTGREITGIAGFDPAVLSKRSRL
ncbi:hypothetical protein I3842_09G213800 [Carya illinoinensis]|uniref:Acyl-CoA oxidase n=1 Tax=Carya illinoinensis TaxID=32201 RepID=A0A922E999_CARIL|nr:hypothetical protein I3842_09G213800 [Carya illinoinensis]